jgi:hypothetical protein
MSNSWNPRFILRFRRGDVVNSRAYIRWSTTGAYPSGEDPLNTLSGAFFSKISTNPEWVFMHNNGAGATVVDPDLNTTADNNIHTLNMKTDASTVYWQIDNNTIQEITTELPSAGSVFCSIFQIKTTNAAAVTFDTFKCNLRCF